jgi:hypothetical protein
MGNVEIRRACVHHREVDREAEAVWGKTAGIASNRRTIRIRITFGCYDVQLEFMFQCSMACLETSLRFLGPSMIAARDCG